VTSVNIGTFTYDGDMPAGLPGVRTAGHIVLTNPDMLHTAILPHHTKWVQLFESLDYVVIDELHSYRGVFGSHLANVLRRLRRICQFYGSDRPSPARRPSPTRVMVSALVGMTPAGGRQCQLASGGHPQPPVVNRAGHPAASPGDARRGCAAIRAGVQTSSPAAARGIVATCGDAAQQAGRQRASDGHCGYLPNERRNVSEGCATAPFAAWCDKRWNSATSAG
jgi:DEAD/DEAH box helicase domain-containing protein